MKKEHIDICNDCFEENNGCMEGLGGEDEKVFHACRQLKLLLLEKTIVDLECRIKKLDRIVNNR